MQRITLELPENLLHIFFPILQKGIRVPAMVGCSLKSLLCEQFAIPADYVTGRITTIFFNNSPVDDLDQTIVQDDSRITLSAAMPGLVGATMRRGGYYAALRGGISHIVDHGGAEAEYGTVRLKLFNLLLAELGPLVLARGLILEHDELIDLLKNLPGHSGDLSASSGKVFLAVRFSY